jgi:hypothetical protein
MPRNNMTHIENKNPFPGYKLTIADWFKFILHTYIPLTLDPKGGVVETSQIFLRDTHILQKLLATRNTTHVSGVKPIAI